MICVTLKNGTKRAFNEKAIFGCQQITAAEKAKFMSDPDEKITAQDRQDMMKSMTNLFTLIRGKNGLDMYPVQEPFEQVACQMEGVELTANDGAKMKLDIKHIVFVTDLRLEDRKDHINCLSRIQTSIQMPTGQVLFDVQEGLDYITSAIKE